MKVTGMASWRHGKDRPGHMGMVTGVLWAFGGKVHEAPDIAEMEWDLQNLFYHDLGVDGAWELEQ